jgi:hypothetical protein
MPHRSSSMDAGEGGIRHTPAGWPAAVSAAGRLLAADACVESKPLSGILGDWEVRAAVQQARKES